MYKVGSLVVDAPDARAKNSKGEISGPAGNYEKVFCVNCGADGGYITKSFIPWVMYLCDYCAERYGTLPLPVVADEIIRGEKDGVF